MPTLNPYLNFKGNTEEVFNFYKSVFGGEFAEFMRWKDMPSNEEGCGGEEGGEKPEGLDDKIMHVSLPIGNGTVLMGSDAVDGFGPPFSAGNNFSIAIGADSKEELDALFNGLSEGGTITMPLADSFWGAYFGMCVDKYGIQWLFNYDYPKQ